MDSLTASHKREVQDLTRQIDILQQTISKQRIENSQIVNEMMQITTTENDKAAELKALKNKVKLLQTTIEENEDKMELKEQQITQIRNEFKQLLSA